MVKALFYDTYAFFEILAGNQNYAPFAKDCAIVTTKFNLFELHYGLLLKYGKEIADENYDALSKFCVDATDDEIKKASELKACLKKKNLSYADCIGCVISQSIGVKFLTGDRQFEGMNNVEFVK